MKSTKITKKKTTETRRHRDKHRAAVHERANRFGGCREAARYVKTRHENASGVRRVLARVFVSRLHVTVGLRCRPAPPNRSRRASVSLCLCGSLIFVFFLDLRVFVISRSFTASAPGSATHSCARARP